MFTVEALSFPYSASANTILAPKRLIESHNGFGSNLQGFDEDLRPEGFLVSKLDGGGRSAFDTDQEIGPPRLEIGSQFNRLRLQKSLTITCSPTDKLRQRFR